MSNGDGVAIGAGVTLTQLVQDPRIRESYGALWQAAGHVATPPLRNMGTIGGNICLDTRCNYYDQNYEWRKSIDFCMKKEGTICWVATGSPRCLAVSSTDTAPALIALEAQAHIVGPKSKRTVSLESFFVLPSQDVTRENVLRPGEIVTEIILPSLPRDVRSSYRKVRARGAWDFALSGAALALRLSNDRVVEWARVVLAGVAPIPWRALDAEKSLIGRRLEVTVIAETATACVKGAEPLSQNAYKIDLVQSVVEESLLAMA